MGYIRVRARVRNVERPKDVREITLLADTEAAYTVLPEAFLRSLSVKVSGRGGSGSPITELLGGMSVSLARK